MKFQLLHRDRSKELCGYVGTLEYCFLPCTVDPRETETFLVRDPFHFSCYVYNHGQPSNPNLLPADLELLIDEFKVNENTVYDDSLKNRICVPDVLGKGLTYCLPGCNDYNFLDFETADDIPPCFVGFRGTFTETAISYINNVIEDPIINEKDICFFTELDEQRKKCESPSLR